MTNETGSVLTGTPASPEQTTAGQDQSQQPAQAAPQQWYDSIDPGALAWAKGRGYKMDDPTEAAKQAMIGHYNAEKLIGLDRAGRTVSIPKDDATPEELDAFHKRLGRPDDAKGYKVPENMRDDPMAQAFLDMAHKAGYTQKQMDPLWDFVNSQAQAAKDAEEKAYSAKVEMEMDEVRKEWGPAFELRSETARRAVREFGITQDQAIGIEKALGVKAAAEMFFQIGKGLMEDRAEGMTTGETGKFGMTPSEAAGKIKDLKSDKEFVNKYLNGDRSARAEMERLHILASQR